ncbi:hypothetical protein DYBT9275_00064 [Dyadobacter sp. CECT 9275]|uniref:DUF5723 domain-containing protein n=1 Tax=Dyadobacter helix TaxID=2822344 RepID=A0A916NJA8_9BACT|nr:hypothetical protein [Dyadobacter sp. CECT 9275]CAG4988358.1 hypothetical protein DYBT9275_00064 [Dyadobacter sp. CECT 9275]
MLRPGFLLVYFCLCCHALACAQQGGQKNTRVQFSGGLNAYAGIYTSSGIAGRNQPNPFGLSGAVTLTLPGGVSLPFSAVLGNQGASFRQPFNQFGMSPTYKWATAHAGYRNVSFSPFTLAGHTFLGGGVELNPGMLRIGAVYGRFNKAISSTLTDPDVIPAFRRTGYAVKVGYGKPGNYVDLVMLRARDDTNSIDRLQISPEKFTAPAENMVIGLTSRLLLIKHVLVEADLAASSYTRDMSAAEVQAEGKNPLFRLAGKLITPRLSTQLTQATQAALGYQGKWGSVKFQYKRIDPNFQTMGAYYFQSDIQSYTGNLTLNLLKGKARLAGSYGKQFDNLAQNKNARTGRSVGSLMVSLNPDPAFGLDLSLSNYGLSQRAGLRPLIDTLRIAQNNLSATANLRYSVFDKDYSHIFTLTGSHQQLSDLNANTAVQTENNSQNANLGYFLQANQSGFGANLMLSYTQTSLPTVGEDKDKLKFYGPTLGSNYAFFKKKITTSVNVSYLVNKQAEVTGKVLTATANAGYQLAKKQTVSINLNYLKSDTGVQSEKFNEFRGNISYGISF